MRSLARYPDVIKWLDENLAWTQQLGTAFLAQPAEVMQAVQRLRARARAAGTLIDTPQQKVITEGEVILIEPASPTVIYVPRYDPEVVYVSRPYSWTQPSSSSASVSESARGFPTIATGARAPLSSAIGADARNPSGSAPRFLTARPRPASPSSSVGRGNRRLTGTRGRP